MKRRSLAASKTFYDGHATRSGVAKLFAISAALVFERGYDHGAANEFLLLNVPDLPDAMS